MTGKAPLPIFCLLFFACSTVTQIVDPSKVYRHELAMTINKVPCSGVCVIKQAPKYEIHVEAARIDYVSLETENRHFRAEDQGDSWDYTYIPNELERLSRVEIVTLDRKESKNGYALFVIENDDYKYPATLTCDGPVSQVGGSSICQSSVGLVQKIEFKTPVKVYPTDDCPLNGTSDGKAFIFKLNKGACTYIFGSALGMHRLTTLGTEDKVLEKL